MRLPLCLALFAALATPCLASAQKYPSAEAGMPELEVATWYGLFAPAKVSPDIIERLNAEVVKFMGAPDAVSQLNKVGLDPAANSPAEFAKFVRAETEKWARVIRAANIKAE
jgi:tripartite-type tricarboxylate transporter receptor subunit TctC